MAHLSVPAGTLDVSGSDDKRDVTITWAERGGPPVKTSDDIIELAVRCQAGCCRSTRWHLNYEWSEAAAIITLVMSKARLLFDAGGRHHATSVH